MTYDNIANRYRPRTINQIRGQKAACEIVAGFLKSGNVPRAILISGPTGTGKTTLARVIAAHLNCLSPQPVEGFAYGMPCGTCEVCEDIINETQRIDVHEIDGADKRGIDDAKALKQAAQYMPRSKFRIYILDECHQFTKDAWASLYKMIERPPPNTIFIPCTNEPASLPSPIIQGRLLHLKLGLIRQPVLVKLIKDVANTEAMDLPADATDKIAVASKGCARYALTLLETFANAGFKNFDQVAEQVIGESSAKLAGEWVTAVLGRDEHAALGLLPKVTDCLRFIDEAQRALIGVFVLGESIDNNQWLALTSALLDAHAKLRSFTPPDGGIVLLNTTLRAFK